MCILKGLEMSLSGQSACPTCPIKLSGPKETPVTKLQATVQNPRNGLNLNELQEDCCPWLLTEDTGSLWCLLAYQSSCCPQPPLACPLHHIYNKELPLIHTTERSRSYRSSEFNLHHCKIKESQPPGFKVVNITLKRWMRRELFKVPVEWVLPIRCRQKVKRVMEPQLVLQFIPSWPVRACAPALSPSAPP